MNFGVIKKTFSDFSDDDAPLMAAALAYYTVFSLPPLLLLVITLVGVFMDPQDVQGRLAGQLEGLFGAGTAGGVKSMIAQADSPSGGVIPTILGVVGLLFGATGAFAQLQMALNRAWEVAPDPNLSGLEKVKSVALKRFFSLGMVLVIAFLFLVSLVLTAVVSALSDQLGALLPEGISSVVVQVVNFVVSFGIIWLLFAAIFKVLPDAKVAWKDVWIGAAVTALLFVAGKFLIGFYIGQSNPGEAYGAAGSLAVILLWVYYSAMIVLIGAEFTQVLAKERGTVFEPKEGAVKLAEEKQFIINPNNGRKEVSKSRQHD